MKAVSYARAKMRFQVALYTGPVIWPPLTRESDLPLGTKPAFGWDWKTPAESAGRAGNGVVWLLPVMTPLSKNYGPMSGVELPHFEACEATHQAAICALERTPSRSRIRST